MSSLMLGDETDSIPCNNRYFIFHQDDLAEKDEYNKDYLVEWMLWKMDDHPVHTIQNHHAAFKYVTQTSVTTFAFSSVQDPGTGTTSSDF